MRQVCETHRFRSQMRQVIIVVLLLVVMVRMAVMVGMW